MITKEFHKKIEMAHKTFRPIVKKFVNGTGKCCISGDPIKDEIFEMMLCLFADWYKEQMMKDAVECLLYADGDFVTIDHDFSEDGYKSGDRVKVIIVKEAEK